MADLKEKERDFLARIENEDKEDFHEYLSNMTIHYQYSVGELTKFFKEIRDNEKLFGTRCTKCGFGFFPPRLNCHKCYVPCKWVELSGKGVIIAIGFLPIGYIIAISGQWLYYRQKHIWERIHCKYWEDLPNKTELGAGAP